ncbi:MAG: hypothetical protein R3326_00345 [Gemmatimonadota bacterium]|nr:hypothetical protein [Gemmatimonadota bacterium]
MRISSRTLASLAVVLSFLIFGCQGGAETEEETAAGTADTVAADTGNVGATTTGLEAGGKLAEVTVTNPMPHAMTVSVEFEGGGANELGTIPPNGSQSFTLAASPGETVRLVAVDADETHSPSTRIDLEQSNDWTIGE